MIDTEKIKELVCDRLCRFPSEYKDPDDLFAHECDKCPLEALLDEQTTETNINDEEEKYYPCTVQVLRNSITGDISIGWWLGEGENNACEVKL